MKNEKTNMQQMLLRKLGFSVISLTFFGLKLKRFDPEQHLTMASLKESKDQTTEILAMLILVKQSFSEKYLTLP